MKLGGLQKFSLLDYPEKISAVVFTRGCPFRCPFCHNPGLVIESDENKILSESEFFSFLTDRVGKLDGVCVTGGEPAYQTDLLDFLRRIKQLGFLVKLDTNGFNPEKIEVVINERLVDFLAMDIKNDIASYCLTVGIPELDITKIQRTAELIRYSGVPYEFRTTVVREFHTIESIQHIGEWLNGASKYVLQQFRDTGYLLGAKHLHPVEPENIADFYTTAKRYFSQVEIRD